MADGSADEESEKDGTYWYVDRDCRYPANGSSCRSVRAAHVLFVSSTTVLRFARKKDIMVTMDSSCGRALYVVTDESRLNKEIRNLAVPTCYTCRGLYLEDSAMGTAFDDSVALVQATFEIIQLV